MLVEETAEWDVPLMVTRGYPSLSFVYSAAESIAAQGKPAYLYYFGDHDPSGVDITRAVEQGVREFAPDTEIHFERVAVTESQITDWGPPTRPTKTTDSRSRGFRGESVEVDAIPSQQLRELARDCIVRHVDDLRYEAIRRVEAIERSTLRQMARDYGGMP